MGERRGVEACRLILGGAGVRFPVAARLMDLNPWVNHGALQVDIWPGITADERKRNEKSYRGVTPAGE